MTALHPSEFAGHPAYLLLRHEGAGRIEIEKVFDAFAGHPPAIDNIRGKIADLKALGFADPVKMIVSSPPILGYAIDNIRGKIADLKALGFADPVKMIVTLPAILGYAIDNIRGKIADLKALGFDAHSLVLRWPVMLSYSLKRYCFCGKITKIVPEGNATLFCELLTKEPVATAVAASDPETVDVFTFHKQLRLRRRAGIAENLAILDLRKSHPVAGIYRAYRGVQVGSEILARAEAA